MPLYATIRQDPDVQVYLWKVNETESELWQGVELTTNSRNRCEGMKSEIHRKGFLSIRHLLSISGYSDQQLVYDKNGKPRLTDGVHISITHSFDFSGIIISQSQEVGIDIELQRPKILRIAKRFAASEEDNLQDTDKIRIQNLTKVWCAKESLYKIMAVPGLRFLDQICVGPLHDNTAKSRAQVILNQRTDEFEVFFSEFEGYTLGYALKN